MRVGPRAQDDDETKLHAVGRLCSADHCPDDAFAPLRLLGRRVEGLPGAQERFPLGAEHAHDVAAQRDRALIRRDGLLKPGAPAWGGNR